MRWSAAAIDGDVGRFLSSHLGHHLGDAALERVIDVEVAGIMSPAVVHARRKHPGVLARAIHLQWRLRES